MKIFVDFLLISRHPAAVSCLQWTQTEPTSCGFGFSVSASQQESYDFSELCDPPLGALAKVSEFAEWVLKLAVPFHCAKYDKDFDGIHSLEKRSPAASPADGESPDPQSN